MTAEWITPADAVEAAVRRHFGRKQRGSARRLRMALIGALRHGQIGWQCERLHEHFTDEAGNQFNPHGNGTSEEPAGGWPNDLWTPALADDGPLWRNATFCSNGEVSVLDAPSEVRNWLGANEQFRSVWARAAENVMLRSDDVASVLLTEGWQVWIERAPHKDGRAGLSRHYRDALIELIAIARDCPESFGSTKEIGMMLANAFLRNGRVIDGTELRQLTSDIHKACNPEPDTAPPDANA